METAHFVTFLSALPDDSFEENGETVRPRGHNVAEIITAELREKEMSVSIVQRYGFNGWTFEGSARSVPFWCFLGYAEPWLLIVKDRRWFANRLFGSVEPFVSVLQQFDLVIDASEHFSALKWFTPREYGKTNGE
jgi:hypothetical protein